MENRKTESRVFCPNCRAVILTDAPCPYCESELGGNDFLVGLVPASYFATYLFVAINSAVLVAIAIDSAEEGLSAVEGFNAKTLFDFGAKLTSAVVAGQYWRLVTAGFLHTDLISFGANIAIFLELGARVEEEFDTSRMAVIYFVATVLGFSASTWWQPGLSVGLSPGLHGLVGAMIASGLARRSDVGRMIVRQYLVWLMGVLLWGIMLFNATDNAAGLGGLAGGFFVAQISGSPGTRPSAEVVWNCLAYICLLLIAASFVAMLTWRTR